MRRTTLILVIALVVVLLGGAGYLWWSHTPLVLPWATTTNTNTAKVTNTVTTTTNTAAAPTNLTLPTEVKGDTAVSGTLNVGTTVLTISSQQKTTTANGQTAESGKAFLLVFFDAIEPAKVLAVDQGLRGAKVASGTTVYDLTSLKVASTAIKGDRGFLEFVIPTTASNLKLQLGTGTAAQTVVLK